jgi:hypothetical protein
MRTFVLVTSVLFSMPVEAELYRWIDPETGSVKYSTTPPYDSRVNAQVVPFKAPPAPPPAATPATMAAQPPQPGALPALEARWSGLLGQLAGLTPQDFRRAGDGLRQQIEAYGALAAELDRLDPAGSDRRRTQSEGMLERLRRGLAAQAGQQKK